MKAKGFALQEMTTTTTATMDITKLFTLHGKCNQNNETHQNFISP